VGVEASPGAGAPNGPDPNGPDPSISRGASPHSKVVILAGGTGGAKLARGMLDVVGPEELVVIANTGDDIDIYGAHVSPDPDLVSFWLADLIDERGWGLRDDTFCVMDALRALGVNVWFHLGDRDLAWCLERRRMEQDGMRSTEALRELNQHIGVLARVLPMSDEPVRTWVSTAEQGWCEFQQFMIRDRCQGTISEVAFSPCAHTVPHPSSLKPTGPANRAVAPPSQEVLTALDQARAVILGPSNPVISIWPILSVLGDALARVSAPVVSVSPVVGGEIVKGPTAAFLAAYRQPLSAAGVAAFYENVAPGVLQGIVADEAVEGLPTVQADTLMSDPAARARVAERTLSFALSLSR
jgi:LPPG:FO 2-phospho-L-lactate transferase